MIYNCVYDEMVRLYDCRVDWNVLMPTAVCVYVYWRCVVYYAWLGSALPCSALLCCVTLSAGLQYAPIANWTYAIHSCLYGYFLWLFTLYFALLALSHSPFAVRSTSNWQFCCIVLVCVFNILMIRNATEWFCFLLVVVWPHVLL